MCSHRAAVAAWPRARKIRPQPATRRGSAMNGVFGAHRRSGVLWCDVDYGYRYSGYPYDRVRNRTYAYDGPDRQQRGVTAGRPPSRASAEPAFRSPDVAGRRCTAGRDGVVPVQADELRGFPVHGAGSCRAGPSGRVLRGGMRRVSVAGCAVSSASGAPCLPWMRLLPPACRRRFCTAARPRSDDSTRPIEGSLVTQFRDDRSSEFKIA